MNLRFAFLVAAALLTAMPIPTMPAHADETVEANGFPATLVDAGPQAPCVLFISGSGPTDRDGNSPLGIFSGYLRKLAGALAGTGISSLRYDKRGVAGSIEAGPESDLRFADFVDDAARVLDWYVGRCGRPVSVLGHSEGGLVALQLAAARPQHVAALVLVASPGRPVSETLRTQLEAMPGPLRETALRLLARVLAGETTHEVPPQLMAIFRPSVQPYLRSLFALHPAQILHGIGAPALVIGGGRDLQVGRADFDALGAARENDVETAWFETMNHVLAVAPAEPMANFATYADPESELHEGLAERIAQFLESH